MFGLRQRFGKTVFLSFEVTLTSVLMTEVVLFTVPSGYKPIIARGSMLASFEKSNDLIIYTRELQINTSGEVTQEITSSAPVGARLTGLFIYHTEDAEPSQN